MILYSQIISIKVILFYRPVSPLKFLSLGQFYKISHNLGSFYTKMIASSWELAQLT